VPPKNKKKKKRFTVPTIRHGLSPTEMDLSGLHELEQRFAQHGHGIETRGHHKLYVNEIVLAEEVFQPRFTSSSAAERHTFLRHVEELRTQLRTDPDARKDGFDPVVVFPIAGTWYCIEGHARLYAYRHEGWQDRRIRVEVFAGTFREALVESVARNSEIKLALSRAERLEAAWRLTLAGVPGSNRELARSCRVAHNTIGKMREVARYGLPKKSARPLTNARGDIEGYHPEDLRYTPAEVRRFSWALIRTVLHTDERHPDREVNFTMLEKQRMIKTLHRHFPKATERPDLFASALAAAFPAMQTTLARHLERTDVATLYEPEEEEVVGDAL
jgi:hypothetical protein